MFVFLPWRPQPSRMPAFEFCAHWWETNGFRTVTVDAGGETFSLAASRNLAAETAGKYTNSPIVIADADTVGDITAIMQALKLTATEQRTYLPYTEYRSLGDLGTRQALHGLPLGACAHFHYPPAVSGLYVTTPSVWASYGGQDPRFIGWGPEDVAHLHAHETLIGPLGRTKGNAYALGHVSEPKSGPQYDLNVALMHRYGAASGDREAMLELIAERQDLAAL